ncbi:MAG: hypothetical protein JWP89_6981 [Schlesneria sp.]|nr:hypothetical protein [Schlesneria sp.]
MPSIQTHCRAATHQLSLAVILCGFGFCGAVASESSPAHGPIHQVNGTTHSIDFSDADSVLLEYPDWLTTVKSLDPAIIRVTAVRPNCLRIQRVGQGTTELRAVDRRDHQYVLAIIVPALANVR